MDNLKSLAACYSVYTPYGFLDAVDVGTGQVSEGVLVLDQGMILASIANILGQDVLQHAFATGDVEAKIKPLLAAEQFEIAPLPPAMNHDLAVARTGLSWERPTNPAPVPPRRLIAAVHAPSEERSVIPIGGEPRLDVVGPRRTPVRRRVGKASERRRSAI
jgi:hypothetical protein